VAREAFGNAFNRGYFPAIDQLANNAYTDNGKEYKQAFLALYARYVIATARPIVDAMVADGSARDHAAGVRFLLEQAIAYGDADSELTLAKLIASGILRNEDPLEAATRVRIALRLGSPDVRKGAELVWEQVRQAISEGQQAQAEFDADHFVVGALPPVPAGLSNTFLLLESGDSSKNNTSR